MKVPPAISSEGAPGAGKGDTTDAVGTQQDLPPSLNEPKNLKGNPYEQPGKDRFVQGAIPTSPLPCVQRLKSRSRQDFRDCKSRKLSIDGAGSKSKAGALATAPGSSCKPSHQDNPNRSSPESSQGLGSSKTQTPQNNKTG